MYLFLYHLINGLEILSRLGVDPAEIRMPLLSQTMHLFLYHLIKGLEILSRLGVDPAEILMPLLPQHLPGRIQKLLQVFSIVKVRLTNLVTKWVLPALLIALARPFRKITIAAPLDLVARIVSQGMHRARPHLAGALALRNRNLPNILMQWGGI
jgi:hypothetical protein